MGISQYHFNGNWIKTYPSINAASKSAGISAGQLRKTIKQRNSYAGGYIWRQGSRQKKPSKIPDRVIKKLDSDEFHSTVISQYDISGKKVKEYENLKAAAKAVRAQPNATRNVILGDSLSAKDYY